MDSVEKVARPLPQIQRHKLSKSHKHAVVKPVEQGFVL